MVSFSHVAHSNVEFCVPMSVVLRAVGRLVQASVWLRGALSGSGVYCGHTTLETQGPGIRLSAI